MAEKVLRCEENCPHQKKGICHIKCHEGANLNECVQCECTICESKESPVVKKAIEDLKKSKPSAYESKAKVVRIAYEAGVTVEYKGKYYKENYREERVFEGEDIDIDTERQLLVDAVHDVVDKAVVEALEAQKS